MDAITIGIIIWMILFTVSMVGMYKTKDKQNQTVPELQNGDYVQLIYLPPCRNGQGTRNPYTDMEGTVSDFDGVYFSIFTGSSWLTCVNINTCKFIKK
jgi:hypothetical protein